MVVSTSHYCSVARHIAVASGKETTAKSYNACHTAPSDSRYRLMGKPRSIGHRGVKPPTNSQRGSLFDVFVALAGTFHDTLRHVSRAAPRRDQIVCILDMPRLVPSHATVRPGGKGLGLGFAVKLDVDLAPAVVPRNATDTAAICLEQCHKNKINFVLPSKRVAHISTHSIYRVVHPRNIKNK